MHFAAAAAAATAAAAAAAGAECRVYTVRFVGSLVLRVPHKRTCFGLEC